MTPTQSKTERLHTVVIGAGQNGLAVGYHLARQKLDFVIVDGAAQVGDSWRNRWDSLRLFTWAYFNNMPGMDFPAPKMYLPTKDETAAYLETYAEKFALPIRMGVKVKRVSRQGERYIVDAGAQRFEADNVVIATGPFQTPRTPPFASELDPSIVQLHSAAYKNPGQLRDGDTLVVGAACSGSEIGIELAKTRRVFLAGRSVDSIPPGKQKIIRPLIPFVFGRPQNSFIGKKLFAKARTSGHPLIGFSYKNVLASGVERTPRVAGIRDGKPYLDDGRVLDVANVIWSTGYRPDFSFVDLPVFEPDGYPRHKRGVVEEEPGLYFVGLIFLHSLSSQIFLGTKRDTKHVAENLIRRSEARRPALVGAPGLQAG